MRTSAEREALEAIDAIMNQLGDLANVIAGDIDADAAGTSVAEEIDAVREMWRDTSRALSRLRRKHQTASR